MKLYYKFHVTYLLLLLCQVGRGQFITNKPRANINPDVSFVDSNTFHPVYQSYDSLAKINWVRVRSAMGRVSDTATFRTASYLDVKEVTEYDDGLGRALQQVSRQSTPAAKDLVSPVVYDEQGRQAYSYLPYVPTSGAHTDDGKLKRNPFADQYSFASVFYNAHSLPVYREEIFYGKTEYEASPLNRVLKTMAPGNAWAGKDKGVDMFYMTNTASDSVRLWTISNDTLTFGASDSSRNLPVSAAIYEKGQLEKNVFKDEAGHVVVEYKDKEGHIVLKKVQVDTVASDYTGYTGFLCTYYVYDEVNRLRLVLQPKAVALLRNTGWVVTPSIASELAFRYEYDYRDRVIAKKTPGAGWFYLIYDQADRLVFTQDAGMRSSNRWLATLYDEISRPVTTGFIQFSGSRSILQNYVSTNTQNLLYSRAAIIAPEIKKELFVNQVQRGTTEYLAQTQVTVNPDFESTASDNFVMDITTAPPAADSVVISSNPLPVSTDSLLVLTVTYYDDYSYNAAAAYSEAFNQKLDSGLHAEPKVSSTEQQKVFTKGLSTVTRVRVMGNPDSLETGDFLTSLNFYDDRGRLIQTQNENYKTGKDTTTFRYNFTGEVLCTYVSHHNPAAGREGNVRVKTTVQYDHANRPVKVWNTINDDTAAKALIGSNEYDELGQLKKKELGKLKDATGAYTNVPVEALDYVFNVRGWIRGINADYANNQGSTNRWFGMELCYDIGFDSIQLGGNISGIKWRSKAHNTQMAYGFTYDKANRLLDADYNEFEPIGGQWIGSEKFRTFMGDGTHASTAYDENGNIKKMRQYGYAGISNLFDLMDNLSYNYAPNSNKLWNVIDSGLNLGLGDFQTSTLHPAYNNKNAATVDYAYDASGNLIKDLNKAIGTPSTPGIQYNYLNLPYKVTMQDSSGQRGSIFYTYDAYGNKLEKRVAEKNLPVRSTTYLEEFVYQDDLLQYVLHQEGRTRYAKKYYLSGDSAYRFFHDYFIKDHLGNVRSVLTEQQDTAKYLATMEVGNRQKEEQLFSKISQTVYPASSVPGGYPVDTLYTNPNDQVARVNGNGSPIGPSLVLKVMAGDKVDLGVKSFYRPNASPGGNASNVPATVVQDLLQALVPLTGGAKGYLGGGQGSVGTSPVQGVLTFLVGGQMAGHSDVTGKPKAYLNWLFVSESFDGTPGSYPQSGAIRVGNADTLTTLAITGIDIKSAGYLYVYVSNETNNWDVFFDNLAVKHYSGPLLEEAHYYPFGLSMAMLSSKSIGKLENHYKFNSGTELNKDLDLNWYETKFRGLDPQIGRFVQVDRYADDFHDWSPYNFAVNNPIAVNDPMGLDTLTRRRNLAPVYVVAKVPKKLDSEHGQVMPPQPWYAWIVGSSRSWHGYYVDAGGYVHPYSMHILQAHDFGAKAEAAAAEEAAEIAAKAAAKGAPKWLIYRAYKMTRGRLTLYIGKAKNTLENRYPLAEAQKIMADAIKKLENLPDNATALGVEQAILDLNGGKGVLANVNNAAVKKIYLEAGQQWLKENVPNWKELFKFDLYK
jgi:RHS repeat-associated protein